MNNQLVNHKFIFSLTLFIFISSFLISEEIIKTKEVLHEARINIVEGQKVVYGIEDSLISKEGTSGNELLSLRPIDWSEPDEKTKVSNPFIKIKVELRTRKSDMMDCKIIFTRKYDAFQISKTSKFTYSLEKNFKPLKGIALISNFKNGVLIYKIPFAKNKTHIRYCVIAIANNRKDLSEKILVKENKFFSWTGKWQ